MQDCVNRAADLLGADVELIVAKPLEQFTGEREGSKDSLLTAQQDEYASVLKRYYGFASFCATVFVLLMSISLWIVLH